MNSAKTCLMKSLNQRRLGRRPGHAAGLGGLVVERPGLAPVPVDVAAIARFCQRGPNDCNYATDQLLLELRGR